MANDIDIWNDIEQLKREGKKLIEQANRLTEIHAAKFCNFDDDLAEELREKYMKDFTVKCNYW